MGFARSDSRHSETTFSASLASRPATVLRLWEAAVFLAYELLCPHSVCYKGLATYFCVDFQALWGLSVSSLLFFTLAPVALALGEESVALVDFCSWPSIFGYEPLTDHSETFCSNSISPNPARSSSLTQLSQVVSPALLL